MRKYQQVALLILACFSLFGLLIYRKEYIELRSIFEGFHIFGDDIIIKTNCNDSVLVINNNENRLYNDGTKWVYIDHGIYIYSAYLINNKLIKAIGIGRKDSVMLTMKCHVWYDFRDTVFSYEGKFRYNILSNVNSSDNQENFIIIEYSCELDDNTKRQGVPHILVFIVNNNKNFVRIAKDNYKDAVMCVYPDYNNLNKLSIVEFISYHQILGYTDFIIYDELNFVILERLQSIIYKLNLSNSFHIFPSNIPYGSSMQTANILFELDCIYRTLNKVSLISLLTFQDFIIPKEISNKNIMSLYKDIKPNYYIKLDQRTCCINSVNDRSIALKQFLPIIVKKTNCIENNDNRKIIIKPNDSLMKSHNDQHNHMFNINSYKICNQKQLANTVVDLTGKKFVNDLLDNKLILLWNYGYFFK